MDSILFGTALAVCRIIGVKVSTAGRANGYSSAIPAWRRRIEERIAKARALIGRLICFRSGKNRPRIVRTVRMAFAGTNISLSQPDITQKLTERIDDLKQRIAAWGKRIRRYTERSTRFNRNRLFQSDQKRLYASLERPVVSGTGPAPNQAYTVAFWRSLWSEPVNHSEGPWTEVVVSQCAGITPLDPVTITPDDVAEAVRRAPNWKSPGLDGLHHYWLKGFMVYHAVLARQFQEAFNQKSLTSLFTTGITHLVPKDQGATDPSKYRPITWVGRCRDCSSFKCGEILITCCEYVCRVALEEVHGPVPPAPRNARRARRPACWAPALIADRSCSRERLQPPAEPDEPDALARHDLQGILEKDFVEMQGIKNDLNRKIYQMKATMESSRWAVRSGAPHLALAPHSPPHVPAPASMRRRHTYQQLLRLLPPPSITGTPTSSRSSTPSRSSSTKL
ncbi:unnamed protein product [Parnassius apollo]|uniref:(apollo) hypothetical protein n=1 Tax=Parnassius apollo TaxID=110799 RepID=A0A8S3X2S1_PARAO|nr:unnamed protein product [Parnassius apollo]